MNKFLVQKSKAYLSALTFFKINSLKKKKKKLVQCSEQWKKAQTEHYHIAKCLFGTSSLKNF